jgi:hypothetical protein
MHSWLGLIELLVVLLFALGWGILELVGLRLDRERASAADQPDDQGEPRA